MPIVPVSTGPLASRPPSTEERCHSCGRPRSECDAVPPDFLDELAARLRALPVATETPGPELPDVLDW